MRSRYSILKTEVVMFFTDLSLCQRLAFASFHTSNAGFFSLEMAGFMVTQQASKQKPCVDLQESGAV